MSTASGSPRPSQRNFVAVWPSLFILSLGLMAVIPTLPFYIEERYGITDPALVRRWSGAIFAAGPLASAFAGPLWGALGDRFGRKAMVLRAAVAIAVCSALIPLAPSPTWMLVVRLAQGFFAGYVAPAMALAAADVPPGRQGRVIGTLQVGLAVGLLVGPVLGAEVSVRIGRAEVFYITAALAALAALWVALIARETPRPRSPLHGKRAWLRELVFAPWRLLANPLLAALLGLVFAMRCGTHMVEPYIGLWVRELGPLPALRHAGEPLAGAVDRTTALAFTVLAVAQIVCTPLWGRLSDRIGPLRCLAAVALALAAALFAISRVDAIEAFLGWRSVAAVFMAGSMTLAYAAVTRRIPHAQQATAFALAQSFIQFGLALGPILGGVLSVAVGLRGLFVVASGILLLTGIAMLALRVVSPPLHEARQ